MKSKTSLYFLQDGAPVCSGHFILQRVFVRSLLLLSLLVFLIPLFASEQISIGAASNTAEIVYSSTSETVLQFQVGLYQKTQVEIDGEKWYQISLSKEGKLLDAGFPELPVMNRSIIIDDQALMKVEVYDIEYEDIHLAVAPSKGDLTRDIDPHTIPFRFDAMYEKDEFYPGEIASLSQPYIMREFRGIVVQTRPFAYNPVSKTLRVFTSYKVRVYTEGLDTVNVLTTSRNELSREFVSIYENHFLNWENHRYTPVSDSFGDILIIYEDTFYDAILPYYNWKVQKGVRTYMVSISSIGGTATHVKSYIQYYYDNYGVTFVQLVGDAAQIPTYLVDGGGADPVYALVAGSDSYPDIFVGRFSAENSAEVTTQVNKVITYERDLDNNQTWLKRATGVASDDGPNDDGLYDYEHMNLIRSVLLNYGYSPVDQIDPIQGNDTAAYLSQSLNDGRGLLNYCGHGSAQRFGTTNFSINNVAELANGDMTPVICSVACLNGNFVDHTCLAESFLRKGDGGAIAFYGSSVSQSWNAPMSGQKEVIYLLVTESKKTVGGLFFNGACKMLDDYPSATNMYKTWNIFGDASMLVRTKTPLPMNVVHTTNIPVGEISTINVATPVPNALVCISYNGFIYSTGYTNYLGNFATTLNPLTNREYTITVTSHNRVTYVGKIYAGFTWTGNSSTNWSNGSNWNTGFVPSATDDVVIPNGCPRYPVTSTAIGNCRNLSIASSASVTVGANTLNVYGDAFIQGQLAMTSATFLNVLEDIIWQSGATAAISNASAQIYCWGDMNFQQGSNVQFAMGYVEFISTSRNCYLTNQSANTQLFHLRTNVSHPHAFIINSYSSADIVIKGSVWNYEGKNSSCLYEGNISIKGNVIDYNTTANGMQWSQGMVILDGINQQVRMDGAASYLNNLHIYASGTVSLAGNLTLKGNLSFQTGYLNPGANTITIAGNWSNNVGPSAFIEGNSTVIFNASGHQYCNRSEDFNKLVLNKSSGALRVNGSSANVTCASYEWISGSVDLLAGTFTAHSLVNNSIAGGWYVNDGCTINLHNTAPGAWIDLTGRLHIFGGTFNVYGGATASYWPFSSTASIEMSSGVLDFKDQGVYLSLSYPNFPNNITGGRIRVNGSFYGSRTDFNPTGGVIEMVGSLDSVLSHGAGSNFYNLVINKSSSRDGDETPRVEIDKEGNTQVRSRACNLTLNAVTIKGYLRITAANEVSLAGNVSCINQGDISVNAGIMNLNGKTLATTGNISVFGELKLTHGSNLKISGGKMLSINSGGRLSCFGNQASNATITRNNTGYYGLAIEQGGYISAIYTIFEYMNFSGVYVKSGGFVDSSYPFDYCIFRYGVSGGRLLRIDSDQNLTITGAAFPIVTGADSYNVSKFTNAGNLYFANWSGNFGGARYEQDPHNRIYWQGTGALPTPELSIGKVPNSSNLRLEWMYPFAASSYKIYRSTVPDGPYTYWTSTTHKYYNLIPTSTHYFYMVKAEVP